MNGRPVFFLARMQAGDEVMKNQIHDCIVIGAGPGGLQAAIYLGRYNRDVLLLDRSGGRTRHARHIENVLAHPLITGAEIVERGIEQVKHFNGHVLHERVTAVAKNDAFTVTTDSGAYRALFVVVSSGVYDIFPPIANVHRYLGLGYYTCIDCDGHHLTNKKTVVMGNGLQAVNLALAVKQMFTPDLTFIPYGFKLLDPGREVLNDEGIAVIEAEPASLIGREKLEGIEFTNGETFRAEAVLALFGVTLNDEFLRGLGLRRDAAGFKYIVNSVYESSLRRLYIVGPLNTGQDQVIIAAGEGAVAGIDINKVLLEIKDADGGGSVPK
jgi:thioredoxin reductase (NADPH)